MDLDALVRLLAEMERREREDPEGVAIRMDAFNARYSDNPAQAKAAYMRSVASEIGLVIACMTTQLWQDVACRSSKWQVVEANPDMRCG